MPGWFNEGLAQLLEEGAPRRLVPRAKDASVSVARAQLVDRELFPLSRLQDSLATWKDTGEITRAYAQSLVLTQHLWENFGTADILDMLRGCKEGRDVGATFEARNGFSLDVVLEDLRQSLNGH